MMISACSQSAALEMLRPNELAGSAICGRFFYAERNVANYQE